MIREWTTVDKTEWGAGPWHDEPDKIQWVDPATDLDCLMHRGPMGNWCGYVGVAEGHPLFGQNFHDLTVDLDVHGGLTYSAFCQDTGDETSGICHVPEPGRPHRIWWLGFDCLHFRDAAPGLAFTLSEIAPETDLFFGCTYKDRAYVEGQVRELARQVKALA